MHWLRLADGVSSGVALEISKEVLSFLVGHGDVPLAIEYGGMLPNGVKAGAGWDRDRGVYMIRLTPGCGWGTLAHELGHILSGHVIPGVTTGWDVNRAKAIEQLRRLNRQAAERAEWARFCEENQADHEAGQILRLLWDEARRRGLYLR